MNPKFTTNKIDNDEFNLKTEQSDYENLITRLKEISSTIALFDKEYLDKF